MPSWRDLEMMNLPEPEVFFGRPDWLTASTLHLLWGETGIGKSFVSTLLALALAAGVPALGFTCHKPRSVLYVDGEMSRPMVRKRVNWLLKGHEFTAAQKELVRDHFYLYDSDEWRGSKTGLDLSKRSGQQLVTEAADRWGPDGADLVILDNVSSLMQVEDDNSAASWNPMVPWLAEERRIGRSHLIIHHAGKDPRKQRGTSRREDILDCSIGLIRPAKRGKGEEEDEAGLPDGARRDQVFWTWKKTRSFAKPPPFEVNIETQPLLGVARISAGLDPEVEEAELEQKFDRAVDAVRERVKRGEPPDFRGIAAEFGVNYATLNRRYNKAYPHTT
jgi:hypothetical protein